MNKRHRYSKKEIKSTIWIQARRGENTDPVGCSNRKTENREKGTSHSRQTVAGLDDDIIVEW